MSIDGGGDFDRAAVYRKREQTLVKHRTLNLYLEKWAHKLFSPALKGRFIRIWYVDCFAGPWQSVDEELRDTSPAIALQILNKAVDSWRDRGCNVEAGAIFVEKNPEAFDRLHAFVQANRGSVRAYAYKGEFRSHIAEIEKRLQSDAAFIFVDPTGWTGAEMEFIRPLVTKPLRDVLVNVMWDYLSRFKEHPEEEQRTQIARFCGCEIRPGLSEEQLMEIYRNQLKQVCGLKYVADLIVQYPLQERTYFRLVVGGHHGEVIRLFRNIEQKVIGEEAPVLRAEAKEADRLERGLDPSFLGVLTTTGDHLYAADHRKSRERAKELLLKISKDHERKTYAEVWPRILEQCRMTESDLGRLVLEMRDEGVFQILGMTGRQRTLRDEHVLTRGDGRQLKKKKIESDSSSQGSLF